MKIIKHGKVIDVHFACKECECEFEADASEYITDLVFSVDGYHRIAICSCPECCARCTTELKL